MLSLRGAFESCSLAGDGASKCGTFTGCTIDFSGSKHDVDLIGTHAYPDLDRALQVARWALRDSVRDSNLVRRQNLHHTQCTPE